MTTDPRYMIDTAQNKEFLRDNARSLLSFGVRFASPGGSSYWLGDDGTPWTDRNRETWITCRMAHVYALGTALGFPGSRPLVEAALRGIRGELHDTANGGWYPGVTPQGEHLEGKQCYAHAFVILAACSASLAGADGASGLLEEALELYDKRFWNDEEGLACDTWNTEFTVLDDYRGLNANMHTVEAFLAVADVTGREEYRRRAGRMIDRVIGWAGANEWRIPEHFDKNWRADLMCNKDRPDDQFKPFGATPGHGIEWSRLITQWALSTYGRDSEKTREYVDAARKLFDRAVEDGWFADGAPGIVYTTDWEGKPVVHDRMHWTLAEGINASAVLYHVTGDDRYAQQYAAFMAYLDDKVIDHVNGSWFHQLDRENRLLGTVWKGKSDLYHALQAMLIPYLAPDRSVAPALFEQQRSISLP
ncbi:MAG: AGE family epimerase/isomerase [Eubacteriales bacterium]|nr:AGE family epimerase/isomerase [Eubacteriales bacterium]